MVGGVTAPMESETTDKGAMLYFKCSSSASHRNRSSCSRSVYADGAHFLLIGPWLTLVFSLD